MKYLIRCLVWLVVLLIISVSSSIVMSSTKKEPPFRYFPTNGERNVSLTPTLHWLNQEGVDYYRVWIEGTTFSEICYGSSVVVPKDYLLEGSYYQWHIQAFFQDGTVSLVSSPWSFRTQVIRKDLPEEPVLSSPFYDQMDVSIHTNFTWYGGNRANGYQLIIREANENRQLVWKSDVIQSSTIVAPYGVLERNKRYAWSMISMNEKGSSPESPPSFFYTEK